MRLLGYGDRAVLVELDDTGEAVAFAGALTARLREDDVRDLVEQVVPAARTVLVVARGRSAALRTVLEEVAAADRSASVPSPEDAGAGTSLGEPAEVVEVPVVYDGDDLGDVAELTGLSRAEVVAAHTGQTWRVAFGGFAPGFGYLASGDDRLHVPRRAESRTTVPRGSVGLAGEYSGVYPTASPGGWQLIGRTDLVLWDVERDPPALFRPGVGVRFVDAGAVRGDA